MVEVDKLLHCKLVVIISNYIAMIHSGDGKNLYILDLITKLMFFGKKMYKKFVNILKL